jgi:hypothetical protein
MYKTGDVASPKSTFIYTLAETEYLRLLRCAKWRSHSVDSKFQQLNGSQRSGFFNWIRV